MNATSGQDISRSGSAQDRSRESGPRVISVHVVDDHPAIREALLEIVSDADDLGWHGGSESVKEAMAAIEDDPPDVVVIDIALGDGHGLDLVRHIDANYPQVRTLIFSVYDEALYAERAIRAGALGYVMKSEETAVVRDAIRSVYHDDVFLSRRIAARILGKVVRNQDLQLGSAVDQLTNRERAVFQMLGEGVSMNDIAERLDLSRKTVETYRRRAKEKLGFDTIEELIQYAVQWRYGHEQSNC